MLITQTDIKTFQKQLSEQSLKILSFWATYSPDPGDNGFWGELNDQNQPVRGAKKGSVLNARMLWSFATGYGSTKNEQYLKLADNAFTYYLHHFKDPQFGGAYWYVAPPGGLHNTQTTVLDPVGSKKQIYAQAFWIYALSAYYKVTQKQDALLEAISLFNLIEKYSHDPKAGGYFEAFARDWSEINDQRLSSKDLNTAKTMNTHLHILEGYMALFQIWPDSQLKQQISHLLDCFDQYIIDPATHHLRLFFDADFKKPANATGITLSFGHDIEAAWLLLEAAGIIQEPVYIAKMQLHCTDIATAAMQGVDKDTGGLNYECQMDTDIPDAYIMHGEKHWWVQAEALVGFLEAYLQSGQLVFYYRAADVWQYIRRHLLSPTGEWLWGIDAQGDPMTGYYKIGFWKCPYHNLRAMIEAEKRLSIIADQLFNYSPHLDSTT